MEEPVAAEEPEPVMDEPVHVTEPDPESAMDEPAAAEEDEIVHATEPEPGEPGRKSQYTQLSQVLWKSLLL